MKTIIVSLTMALALGSPLAGWAEAGSNTCTTTATAAFSACLFEVMDDYQIGTAKCKNTADADERYDCLRDIRSMPREGRQECGEQRVARLDLCADIGQAPYDPPFLPSMFVNPADIGGSVAPNPFLPIVAGTTRIYEGGDETVTVTVTGDIKVVSGVPCAVVRDIVEENGEVIEDTVDWFAQDLMGNVWYCGEAVQDFEDGELVSLDGSFKAGIDGAKPGILMKAAPMIGDVYRQEFDLGNAEDAAEVLSLTGSAMTPATSCAGTCLITKDFSPLEPDAFEHKYYAPGIGMILEVKPETGERLELVEIIN
ncbi:MAG: hypothetical protein E4H19_06990 [Chromatiales bacterium]|nr:MAG: hypothetical protein E4H19_06990 [Chromatiales bacterium]